jgi:hypothetical protein
MENIISKITELEIKACIYSENYGPNSDEVKAIDRKIAELNTILLDLMIEGEAG